MVPLYAARVQDLGPDDVAVFKCGACGHTAELPPSALLRGLQLKPTDKVIDLERRLRGLIANSGVGRTMSCTDPNFTLCEPSKVRNRPTAIGSARTLSRHPRS